MIDDWWRAHRLEFLASGIMIAIGLLAIAVVAWVQRVRRK